MILVTAANGNQGRLLVPKLVAAGLSVRGCVLSEDSARSLLGMGVADVVVGDICDPAVLARALDGVKSVYHVGPTAHPREREMGLAMVDASRAAEVGHFVFSSVLHAISADLIQHGYKRDIEEHILSSGLEFTILQPTNYMTPFELSPAFRDGVRRQAWSLERRQSLVDLDDVTDVAAKVLVEAERHFGATYELASPGHHSGHDLAGILSRVTGRSVRSEQITADDYLKVYFGDVDTAAFPHEIMILRRICEHLDRYDFVGNPNVLAWLLGREPTTFERFAEKHHAAFLATVE